MGSKYPVFVTSSQVQRDHQPPRIADFSCACVCHTNLIAPGSLALLLNLTHLKKLNQKALGDTFQKIYNSPWSMNAL